MSPVELPVIQAGAMAPAVTEPAPLRDSAWMRDARQARLLSWASLAWMTVEGIVGLLAGFKPTR